jgi:hypothetical protein
MDKKNCWNQFWDFMLGFPFYSRFEDFANEKQDELMSLTKVQNEVQ